MGSHKEVRRARDPFYVENRTRSNYAVLVDSRISLSKWFKPENVASREAHDDVNVFWSLGGLVYVMAEAMGVGEE
jgi:hypothetical protein